MNKKKLKDFLFLHYFQHNCINRAIWKEYTSIGKVEKFQLFCYHFKILFVDLKYISYKIIQYNTVFAQNCFLRTYTIIILYDLIQT